MAQPPNLYVIAGTGTEVGKTWVACGLARRWREAGLAVSARKLAQSFDPAAGGATDAELLAEATGEMPAAVCPPWRWYPKAMAPPMAAASMGAEPFTLAHLLSEVSWPDSADVGLIELAGGLGSPHALDADGVDVVRAVGTNRVVLVSPPGLGALGHVRLAERALAQCGVAARTLVVYLNHHSTSIEIHRENREWLGKQAGLQVAVSLDELSRLLGPAKGLLERPKPFLSG